MASGFHRYPDGRRHIISRYSIGRKEHFFPEASRRKKEREPIPLSTLQWLGVKATVLKRLYDARHNDGTEHDE